MKRNKITDTERLDWLMQVWPSKYIIIAMEKGVGFAKIDSRQAIDAAIRAERKK